MNDNLINVITEIMMERKIHNNLKEGDIHNLFRTIEAINMLDRTQHILEGSEIQEYEIIPSFKCFILPSKVEYKRSDDARDLLVRKPELTRGTVLTPTEFKTVEMKIYADFKVSNKVFEPINRQYVLYNDVETRHLVEGKVMDHKCIPIKLDFSSVYEEYNYVYDADRAFTLYVSDLITNIIPRER